MMPGHCCSPRGPGTAGCFSRHCFLTRFLKLCFRSSWNLIFPRPLPSRLLGRRRCRKCRGSPERQQHREGQDRQGAQALRGPRRGHLCQHRARLAVLETHQEGEWRHRERTSVVCPFSQPKSCVSVARFLTLGGAQGRHAQAGEGRGQRPGRRSLGSVLSRAAQT